MKIPHFAFLSCNKMLQSEEFDLNMKTMSGFLRVLVIRYIPCFVAFHKNKILQYEELIRKSPIPQIGGLIEIPHFVGYSWIKSYKMRNHHLTWLKSHFNESIEQFVSIPIRHWHQKLISQSSSYCNFYHVRYPAIWGIPNCIEYRKFLRL